MWETSLQRNNINIRSGAKAVAVHFDGKPSERHSRGHRVISDTMTVDIFEWVLSQTFKIAVRKKTDIVWLVEIHVDATRSERHTRISLGETSLQINNNIRLEAKVVAVHFDGKPSERHSRGHRVIREYNEGRHFRVGSLTFKSLSDKIQIAFGLWRFTSTLHDPNDIRGYLWGRLRCKEIITSVRGKTAAVHFDGKPSERYSRGHRVISEIQ